jgi:hypothetical protein
MQMERDGLQQQQQQGVEVVEAGSGGSSSQALAAKRGRNISSKAAGAAAAAADFAVEDHKQEGACMLVYMFCIRDFVARAFAYCLWQTYTEVNTLVLRVVCSLS